MSVEAPQLFNVNGLVALVTGGGTGIGLMMTKALAKNGAAKVYIAGRRLQPLQDAASSIGPNVIPLQCDVTSKDDLTRAAGQIKSEAGVLNLLICNSGISGPHPGPLTAETTLEDFAARNMALGFDDYVHTFSVNVAAVWFTTMAFLPLLDAGNKKGNVSQTSQVIITSSIAGLNKVAPGGWAYGQSKAAAIHTMKHLSAILPKWHIRANCIAPGFFPSEMADPLLPQFQNPDGSYAKNIIPLERLGDEQDMGGTTLYLASRAGAYTNGSVMVVDGARLTNFPSVG